MADESKNDIDPISTLGKLPIEPNNPTGSSVRYEPEYDLLDTEVSKLESLTSETVDWAKVEETSILILKTKSKDLLVASFLCYALFLRKGYNGLTAGFEILHDMLSEYWDSFFPLKKRMKGRIAAIEWFVSHILKVLPQKKITPVDNQYIIKCKTQWDAIDSFLSEKLQDNAPNTVEIKRYFTKQVADINRQEEEKEKKKTDVEAKKESAATSSSTIAGAQDVLFLETVADAQKALKKLQGSIRQVATFLRNKNPQDALSYRILRCSTWLMIDQIPPNKDNVTQIPQLPANVLQGIETNLKNENLIAVINEVETNFVRVPFWLDCHRYLIQAMEGLGPAYQKAKKAVVEELRNFLRRFPAILDLKFANGSPFANDQTILWIKSEVISDQDSTDNKSSIAEDNKIEKEVKSLLARGKFPEAIKLFKNFLKPGSSQREIFVWKLKRARYCYDAGYINLAIPQLEYLNDEISRFCLEEWEPDLSVEVIYLLLFCYSKSIKDVKKTDSEIKKKATHLYSRLCHLDLHKALEFEKMPYLKIVE